MKTPFHRRCMKVARSRWAPSYVLHSRTSFCTQNHLCIRNIGSIYTTDGSSAKTNHLSSINKEQTTRRFICVSYIVRPGMSEKARLGYQASQYWRQISKWRQQHSSRKCKRKAAQYSLSLNLNAYFLVCLTLESNLCWGTWFPPIIPLSCISFNLVIARQSILKLKGAMSRKMIS